MFCKNICLCDNFNEAKNYNSDVHNIKRKTKKWLEKLH